MAEYAGGERGSAMQDIWAGPESEDRFARVVEALPAALVLSRLDGHIEMVNRQCERMFGYDRDELRDQPLEILIPERYRHEHAGLRDRCFATHSLSPATSLSLIGEGPELFGVRKDGTEFPFEISLNPVELKGIAMVAAIIVDVTARRRIEAEQEQRRADLARSNADLEEFAYVASHDLKAPLRAISHLVEWIAEDIGAAASAETIDNLGLVRGRVVRLQLLLDGLLAYARIGRSRSNFETFDVPTVVRDIVSVLSPPSGFTITCDEEMPPLRTHRDSIMVVLQNLIGNAIRHHDRADGHVNVAMRVENGVAEFRVGDDGPGIAPRFHERIFVIFQTLASRDDVESSGIGLAIVKKRVEGHGGRIRVESGPPMRGTTFIFTWKEAVS
jgi:PAS domain S-box-containing protein